MTGPYEEMANLNRLIHEPARLAILTALSACESADFTFLQKITGMTAGNLSAHIAKLEEGQLVESEKNFVNKRPNTLVKITELGLETINNHWTHLQALREQSSKLDLNQEQ
jgi:DNA-binding MarR family transcriptional regulator